VRITDIAANHFAPAFSPDGRFVAWLSDWTGFGGLADLWLSDRDKGETRQITRNAKITEFCWLPDSRTIVYSAGVNLRDFNTIDVVSLASAKLIVASGPKTWNETSPQVIRYRGAPRLLYVRDYEEERKEVWWVNLDGSGDEKAVTAKGNAWLR